MTTYTLCKRVIERKTYKSIEDMQNILDVFFAGGRLNTPEYEELTDLLNAELNKI